MRRNYRIASSARPGGLIDRVVRALGTVTEVGKEGWLANSDVVVVDCSDATVPQREADWRRILELGKTLGLVGMQADDQAMLQRIVGRSPKASRKSLFVRRSTADAERYMFTVVPDFDDTADSAKCAAFLAERVFTDSCCNPPTPVAPPETINDIWPVNSEYGKLFASRRTMISGWKPGGSWPDGSVSQVTFEAVGHFFLGNGDGGDNAFHVIIVSRMSNVVSLVSNGSLSYGFGLQLTPSAAPMNVYSTQPMANNTPAPPQSWGPLGTYIRTYFGYDPAVQIKILGTPPGSNVQQTFILNPMLDEYRNAFTTPGIQNFTVYPNDSGNSSWVQFNSFDGLYPGSSSALAGQLAESPRGAADAGADAFVVVSYFRFANPGTGSFVVNFNFDVQLFAVAGGYWVGQFKNPVAIDLVAATRLAPVTLPE